MGLRTKDSAAPLTPRRRSRKPRHRRSARLWFEGPLVAPLATPGFVKSPNERSNGRRASGCLTGIAMAAPIVPAQVPAGVPQFRVTTSVVDNRGNPVKGLTAADFVVTVGDVARGATHVEVDSRPLSIVVIVDGTVPDEAFQIRTALKSVLKQLRRGGAPVRLGLIIGEEGARVPVLQDAQASAAEHDRQVSKFFMALPTATPVDTIGAAIEALRKEEDRRRAVLFLSVNRRELRHVYLEDLAAALRQADVTLAVVESTRGPDQTVWLLHQRVGGFYSGTGDVPVLGSLGSRLAGGLTAAYRVTFPATEATNLPMRVSVKGWGGLTVIAPAWALR